MKKLLQKSLKVNLPSLEEKKCQIVKIHEGEIIVEFQNFIPPQTPIILTGFINNHYTEIELTVTGHVKDNLYQGEPKYLRISSQQRKEPRYNIDDPEEIYIHTIKITISELNYQGNTLPVSYRIILDKYRSEKAGIANEIIFEGFEQKSDIYKEIQKTGKTLYISNIQSNEAFETNISEDIIDAKKFFGSELNNIRRTMSSSGKIGWIICPILGPISEGNWIPICYMELFSKTPFSMEKLMEVKTLSFEIVESFREITILEIKDKQQIIDVSNSGLSFITKNDKLIDALQKRPSCICDIIIRHQAPITIMASVRMNRKLEDGTTLFGIKIEGETNRTDQMHRYHEYIKTIEKKIEASGKHPK
jgi:hypothetical protein